MRFFALATDTLYSQITQAAAASQRARDHSSMCVVIRTHQYENPRNQDLYASVMIS